MKFTECSSQVLRLDVDVVSFTRLSAWRCYNIAIAFSAVESVQVCFAILERIVEKTRQPHQKKEQNKLRYGGILGSKDILNVYVIIATFAKHSTFAKHMQRLRNKNSSAT